jgi:hypothetical protein
MSLIASETDSADLNFSEWLPGRSQTENFLKRIGLFSRGTLSEGGETGQSLEANRAKLKPDLSGGFASFASNWPHCAPAGSREHRFPGSI